MKRQQLELFSFQLAAAPKRRIRSVRQRAAQSHLGQFNIIEYLDAMTVFAQPVIQSPFVLYGGHLPHAAGSETSREAAHSMLGSSAAIRNRVFTYVQKRSLYGEGATCDEIELGLNLSHQTASARCRELVLMGLLDKIIDPMTGKNKRRPTRSGRNADVLFATKS